jgi:alkanesulfonate monooxygenase SsuD/methylene tetrahydromethanopterin reductase-like flavin-dependent oxidoreductase (luciferase family)
VVDAAARQLKLGVMLPHAEARYGGETARWSNLLAMARLAEEAGFDSVWTIDHFQLPDLGAERGLYECWSLLAALAAVTSRVEIGPLVSCTAFRNPALLAKIADTIDEISAGRLILGLGAGWHEIEYRQMGLPYDHRIGRFEEALRIIHGLLNDGAVDFEGTYYSARECELRPRGPRPDGDQGHIPILIGSSGVRMLGLAARYADQWNAFFTSFGNSPAGIAPLRDNVDAACRAAGRDPSTMERSAAVMVGFDLPGARGRPDVPNVVKGEPEEIAATLTAFGAEGITHIQLYLDPMTERGIEAFVPVLERLTMMRHPTRGSS